MKQPRLRADKIGSLVVLVVGLGLGAVGGTRFLANDSTPASQDALESSAPSTTPAPHFAPSSAIVPEQAPEQTQEPESKREAEQESKPAQKPNASTNVNGDVGIDSSSAVRLPDPGSAQTIAVADILSAVSLAAESTRIQASELATKCLAQQRAACTRLGVIATQANARTYSVFRKLAFALACELGDGVFSCSHYHSEEQAPARQLQIRLMLDKQCKAGDDRLCAALGNIVQGANPVGAEKYFQSACASNKNGFSCLSLVDHYYRTRPVPDAEKRSMELCDQGKPGACYQLSQQSFARKRGPAPRQLLEKACNATYERSPWFSPACANLSSLALRSEEIDKALTAFTEGCRLATETSINLCRSLARDLVRAKPEAREQIKDALQSGCQRIHLETQDCVPPLPKL